MIEILSKVESVIGHSFNVPISFRLELYYMQAKLFRRKFCKILLNFQQTYFRKF
jgi:hypothetical protein